MPTTNYLHSTAIATVAERVVGLPGDIRTNRPPGVSAAAAPLPGAFAPVASDAYEGLRMSLSDAELIAEAITCNYAEVPKRATLAKYEKHLGHLALYLRDVHGASFYTARRKHIKQFMTHLQARGGAVPDASRVACSWCADRSYPDGRGGGPGWSPSTCKSYLAAARFLYTHFAHDEELPDFDPTGYVRAPKLVVAPQYTPSREEVQAILDAPAPARPPARPLDVLRAVAARDVQQRALAGHRPRTRHVGRRRQGLGRGPLSATPEARGRVPALPALAARSRDP